MHVTFLRLPPSRLLPLDRWNAVARETIAVAVVLICIAAVATFLFAAKQMREPLTNAMFFVLLPGAAAGVAAAQWFEYRFEQAFPDAPQDVTSVAISVALWTALPQMVIALAAAWIHLRVTYRREEVAVVRETGAEWIVETSVIAAQANNVLIQADTYEAGAEQIRIEG